MTRPRAEQIDLQSTPYYHVISRCVRRAFLCGEDRYTGQNFDHRKPRMIERLKLLADVFTIDIAAYAIMSNHYHLVLHVDAQGNQQLTDEAVIARWTRLYALPPLLQRQQNGHSLSKAEHKAINALIATWRERLGSISWFMSNLNEAIAREANREDNCKGRFWEGRFKSQALLDDTALLSCMAYVDLNPVRAGISMDVEGSDFTSIQDRLKAVRQTVDDMTPRLMPFIEYDHHEQDFSAIPFNLKDYIDLVDWTGRIVREDKRGAIAAGVPKLVAALGLNEDEWRLLAIDVQQRSLTTLHGLDYLARRQRPKRAA